MAEPENSIMAALLTGGRDPHYTQGLATSLLSKGVALDVIGSDSLDLPVFRSKREVNFLNLRGSNRLDVAFTEKVSRLFRFYVRLIRYAANAKPRIFHVLWNNKFEFFDRTLLLLYYKLMGKKVVHTAHNVNEARRDSKDTLINRLTLRIQYRLADHIFVHTDKMKMELIQAFGVPAARITVIPFGIYHYLPNTGLTSAQAKKRLGLREESKTLLFYGQIAPRKGLEFLVAAFHKVAAQREDCQLIIAGAPDKCDEYWKEVQRSIREDVQKGRVVVRAEFIPDEETEVYFKAADAFVLPYREIFQSGVLFVGYNFGLPALVADVGSLKDEIVEGKTGYVFRPGDSDDLAGTIEKYLRSELCGTLDRRRQEIRDYVAKRHSWEVVGNMTASTYANLLGLHTKTNNGE